MISDDYLNYSQLLDDSTNMLDVFEGDCGLCFERLEAESTVKLMKCGHSFHYDCMIKLKKRNKSKCPICHRDFKNLFLQTTSNCKIQVRVKYRPDHYSILHSYSRNNISGGHSILLGFYKHNMNEKVVKFHLVGTSHLYYFYFTTWNKYFKISRKEYKNLSTAIQKSKFSIKKDLQIKDENISNVATEVLLMENMINILLTVMLEGGLKHEEMADIPIMMDFAETL